MATNTQWHANAVLKGRIVGDENSPRFDKIHINGANRTIATVYRSADATLIKHAPDLLSALVAVLPYIDDADDVSQFFPDCAATTACRAAVAKCRALIATIGA